MVGEEMVGMSSLVAKVPSLPPPRPKSPPQYPDLYGKRRELAKVQMLEREISFLEDELKFVAGLQPASKACKEVAEFLSSNSDPLTPTTKRVRKSCWLWRWLCGSSSCFSLPWICCNGCTPKSRKRCCSLCSCNLCDCECISCSSCFKCTKPKNCCCCTPCPKCQCQCLRMPSCSCSMPKCPSCSCCNCFSSIKCNPSCCVPKCPKLNLCSCCTKDSCCCCSNCFYICC